MRVTLVDFLPLSLLLPLVPSLQGFPGVRIAAGQRDHEQTPGEERAVKEIVY